MIYNSTLNDYERVCNSCTMYIVLLVIDFLIIIGTTSVIFLFLLVLKRKRTNIITRVETEKIIY